MPGVPEMTVPEQSACLGLEPDVFAFTAHLVHVFRLVREALRDDGCCWVNMGDSFAGQAGGAQGEHGQRAGRTFTARSSGKASPGLKPKDLVMQPHRLALALQADGWYVRSAIVWAKGLSFCPSHSGSVKPESCRDRPTKAHEMVFLLTKRPRYFYDQEAVREAHGSDWLSTRHPYSVKGNGDRNDGGQPPQTANEAGRNLRDVWCINPEPTAEAHFATWPSALVAPMIRAGTSERGCCATCGAPWERVVERGADERAQPIGERTMRWNAGPGNAPKKDGSFGNGRPVVSAGWRASCDHGDDPVPCTVLDPFTGSGTTGRVALSLGRRFVGCELNPAYAKLAADRITDAPGAGPSTREADMPLFRQAAP